MMKAYRKPSGAYIELDATTPVNAALIEVAKRPSLQHVWADQWATAPTTASVCWREMTLAERQAEQDAIWQATLDSPTGRLLKVLVLIGVEKGIWTLEDVRTQHRMLSGAV